MAEDQKTTQVSQEELDAAFAGPAVLANRVTVTIGPAGVLIAFSELTREGLLPQLRARVVMPIQDAMSFSKLLVGMLAPVEQVFASAPTIEAKKDG
jgi:hypothetical protein